MVAAAAADKAALFTPGSLHIRPDVNTLMCTSHAGMLLGPAGDGTLSHLPPPADCHPACCSRAIDRCRQAEVEGSWAGVKQPGQRHGEDEESSARHKPRGLHVLSAAAKGTSCMLRTGLESMLH